MDGNRSCGYRIVGWRENYEVSMKGRAAGAEEEALRKGPLEFVRLRVNGRSWGEGWRCLVQAAGPRHAASVFGVFCKLLELAADLPAEHRGRILGRNLEALDSAGIARVVGFAVRDVGRALHVLCSAEVGWVEEEEGSGFRVQGSGREGEEEGSGFRVQGSGREEGSGFRVQGLGREAEEDSGSVREIPGDSGRVRGPLLTEPKDQGKGKVSKSEREGGSVKGEGFRVQGESGSGSDGDGRGGEVESVGEVLRKGLRGEGSGFRVRGSGFRVQGSGEAFDRAVGSLIEEVVRVTGDAGWRRNGHVRRVARVVADGGGPAFWELLERVAKERDPALAAARGSAPIRSPAAMVNGWVEERLRVKG